MGAYVEFIGIYQVALGSEWEEKLYVMSDLQVGKGTQGHHMAITGWSYKAIVMSEGSKWVGVIVRGEGDCMHLFAREQQAGLAGEEETPVLGKKAQASGRTIRWAEGPCWCRRDVWMWVCLWLPDGEGGCVFSGGLYVTGILETVKWRTT